MFCTRSTLLADRERAPIVGAVCALAAMLGGCGTLAPGGLPPGTPIAQARHAVFGPTGEYALPGGGTRLEFSQGSFGKQTYMLDFDNAGSLVSSTQVLTEQNFASLPAGTTVEELRMRFGRPVSVIGVRYPLGHVWNYRFDGGDCVWYQVSVSDATQRVTNASLGPDPACDGADDGRD